MSFTPNALLGGTKYDYAGSTRVAMRIGSAAPLWLLGDHLGSTSQVANNDGNAVHVWAAVVQGLRGETLPDGRQRAADDLPVYRSKAGEFWVILLPVKMV